jgi:hypothetical protein
MTSDPPNSDRSDRPGSPQPSLADPEPGAEGDEFADLLTGQPARLDPRFVAAERFGWWIATGVVCGASLLALLAVLVLTWPPGWLLILVAVSGVLATGMLWGTLSWPQIVYRHTNYLVTPQGLEIRRGVLWRTVTSLPKSRTQHTDVLQGPLQRHFGIATLTTHTAGTENAAVTLAGLSYDRAQRIRDYLIRSTEPDAV